MSEYVELGEIIGVYCPNCGCRMDGEDGESDGTKS